MKRALFLALCLLLGHESRVIADDCAGTTAKLDDLSDVRDVRYILKNRSGLYAFQGDCVVLDASKFRGRTWFAIKNDLEPTGKAVVFAKSIRTFSIPTQDSKLKISRGDGFTLANGREADRIKDRPITTTIESWNRVHAADGTAADAEAIIGDWHADSAAGISSFDEKDFWRLDPSVDYSNKTVTNYMVQFDSGAGNFLPLFYFDRLPQVVGIDVDVLSSIDLLSGHFLFQVR